MIKLEYCNSTFLLIVSNNFTYADVLDSTYDKNGYAIGAFALLFFLAGLPWNGLVIGIILKNKLFTLPTYMLMLNLAIANLLVCVLVLPLTVFTGFGGEDLFGSCEVSDKVCKAGVFLILFPLVSTHTVALLAIDRLIYIKKPLTYQFIVTPIRMLAAIVVVWVLCIGLSIPALTGFMLYVQEMHACGLGGSPEYFIPLLVESALVILLQCVVCAWMLCIARNQLKEKLLKGLALSVGTHNTPQQREKYREVQRKYNKSQLHLVKVFIAIFTASTVTLLMAAVLAIAATVCGLLPPPLYPPGYLLYLSRAVIHPILEAVMTKETRSVLQNCLPKQCRGKQNQLSTQDV